MDYETISVKIIPELSWLDALKLRLAGLNRIQKIIDEMASETFEAEDED